MCINIVYDVDLIVKTFYYSEIVIFDKKFSDVHGQRPPFEVQRSTSVRTLSQRNRTIDGGSNKVS